MKITLYLLFFALAFLTSCHKEKAILPNGLADCGCAEETSADFFMEEESVNVPSVAYYTDTDSIQRNKNVRFKVKQDGGTFKWYIGSEILETPEVTRFFGASTVGLTVPITLVHKRKPNKICFPNDDGYDSIVKYLTITNYPIDMGADFDYGSIEGLYRVKSDQIPDSFDVEIQVIKVSGLPKVNFYNYDGQGSNCINQIEMIHGSNYKELYLLGGTAVLTCDYLRGRIKNIGLKKVEMNLSFNSITNPNYVIRKYLGRKLN
ncbi:MAG: hypothetical protein ACK479_02875 [Fluviicola sp.]|jgi:hypothetical protein